MGIRSLKSASIATGVKRSKFWDQVVGLPAAGFYSLDSYTFPNDSVNTVTFNSIPQDYTTLFIIYNARGTVNDGTRMRFNGDSGSTSYFGANQALGVGANSEVYSGSYGNSMTDLFGLLGNYGVTQATAGIAYINDYSKSGKIKTVTANAGSINSSNEGGVQVATGAWTASTAAITSLTLVARTQNFAAGSMVSIFGIK
jgi:hypothetical protein